jgi:hypothetical protein
MVFAFICGCGAGAYINKFLCEPTPEQFEAAQMGKFVAQAVADVASTFVDDPVIKLVATNAVPVFDKVVAGYCVVQEEWDDAVAIIKVANDQAKSRSRAPSTKNDQAIEVMEGIKW